MIFEREMESDIEPPMSEPRSFLISQQVGLSRLLQGPPLRVRWASLDGFIKDSTGSLAWYRAGGGSGCSAHL